MDCPKCGFSQPEDRYCANCGVDMAAYRPPLPPLSRRILSHWFFQIAVVVVCIAGAFALLDSRREIALRDRLKGDASPPPAPVTRAKPARPARNAQATAPKPAAETDASGAPAPGAEPAPVASGSTSSAAAPQGPAAAPVAEASGSSSSAQSLAGAPAAPPSTAAGGAPKTLRVWMGEFRRGFLNELAASAREAQALNVEGLYSGGVAQVPDAAARIGRESASAATSSDALAAGQTISIFKGTPDQSGRNVGVTIFVNPSSVDENAAALRVQAVIALRDAQDRPYSDAFTIKPQRIAFMRGLLPRRAPDNVEIELYAATPLKILSSREFQSGQTDFAAIFLPVP